MSKSNRLSDYEAHVIELAEDWERAHLHNTGQSHIYEQRLRDYIRNSKREPHREAAKRARVA